MEQINKIIILAVAILVTATVLIPICMDYQNENKLAVVVLAGQSNAQYRSVNVDLDMMDAQGIPDYNVYYYGDSQPIWYETPYNILYDTTFESYGIHSMLNESRTHWLIGSEDAQLALRISEKLNCDVLIINDAIGGAWLNYLKPYSVGNTFCKTVIENAMSEIQSKYDTVEKIGYVWIQGEADRYNSVADYVSNFDLINKWYDSLGFDKCYMVQTRPADGGNASIAQLQICGMNDDVILASTAPATFTTANGLLASDNLHYTQKGRIIVADDVADKIPGGGINNTMLIGLIPLMVIIALIVIAANFRDKDNTV